MVSLSRPINLISKLNPDVFKILNKDVFGTVEQPLGSVQGAVSRIIAPEFEQMLKVLMPTILSINPNDAAWYKKVKNYWDSFGIKVPIGGKLLETGFNFTFNIHDNIRGKNISDLVSLAKTKKEPFNIVSDESLRDYVDKFVTEYEKYKYATPINITQYLIWVFCQGHRKVAKQAEAIGKSLNIEFILIDPREIENTKRIQHKVSIEATKKYLEILPDRDMVKNILFVKGFNASSFDEIDADSKLKSLVDSSPTEFLKIANDTTTIIKAKIERYCLAGILKRLPNSSIIVDGNDNGIVIGNTDAEAIAYFGSESIDRIAKIKEFNTRYLIFNKN